MNLFLQRHHKKLQYIGLGLFLLGIIIAYLTWGTEPEETISGVLCGLGLGLSIIGFGLHKPKN